MNIGFADAVRAASLTGGRALTTEDETLTYLEWVEQGESLARAFMAEGLEPGCRVLVALPNCIDLLIFYYACARVGLVAVPISTWVRGTELERILTAAVGDLLITSDRFPEQYDAICQLVSGGAAPGLKNSYETASSHAGHLQPLPNLVSQSLCCGDEKYLRNLRIGQGESDFTILFTSGSTKDPKGVVLTQEVVIGTGTLFAKRLGLNRRDRIYSDFPMSVSEGLCNLLAGSVSVGAEVVTQPVFDSDAAAELIHRRSCTGRFVCHDRYAAIANSDSSVSGDLAMMGKGLVSGQEIPDECAVEFEESVNM